MTPRILTARKAQITAAAAVAGALFLGVAAPASHVLADSRPASVATVDTDSLELTASSSSSPRYYLTSWDLDDGQGGYTDFIKSLRTQAILATGATRHNHDVGKGKQVAVDTLNNEATNTFSIAAVTSGSHTIHLVIRLSDLYVVGYFTGVDNPNNFDGFSNVYVPLAADAPDLTEGIVGGEYTTRVDYKGKENYNDIARGGNTSLTDTTVGHAALTQSVIDMRNPSKSNQQFWMRGLLRMIMAVSEGARFRTLGTAITTSFDAGGHKITTTDVSLIRNWASLSDVYHHYDDGSSSRASVDIAGWGRIDTLRAVIRLIMIALNTGSDPNPKDEL
ncbi:ribosome-inactivating family protein [Streptomyces sp. NPDC047072]|uniref:ribosome-inactivating family protein n=1 Tax=Streptomyces sp. NPDC047072 TaxID=3154809 RepID=UPI003410A116